MTILHILQHALGRDEYGRRKREDMTEDYRNHYCVGAGGETFALCREAVAAGLMKEHAPRAISGGDFIFTVTTAGETYIACHSPAPPKLSRSKKRYLRWLDGPSNVMTFGEYLRARG